MKITLARFGLFVSAAIVCTGCASFPNPLQQPAKESAATYAERKHQAVAAFEKQRDKVQVQAAVSCWERGEVQKSVGLLQAIVQRNPSDVTARLRLAEILASQENFAAATDHLAECVRLAPDNAEAHHSLGMILGEVPGQETLSAEHLRRACELEPENELYLAATQEANEGTVTPASFSTSARSAASSR